MSQRFFICILLVLGTISLNAEKVQIGDFYYSLNPAQQTASVTYTKDFSPAYNPHNYQGLKEAHIPSNVSFNGLNYKVIEIDDSAFYMCASLIQIAIPKEIKKIGKDALLTCPRLKVINVDDACEFYCSVDNVLFDKSKTVLIKYPGAKEETTYFIPKTVKVIDRCAFDHSINLISVMIPNQVVEIRERAFEDCEGLLSLPLPNSLRIIGKKAFYNCRKLSKIAIPDQVVAIDNSPFSLCWALKVIEIGSGVKEVGSYLFSHCSNLETVICHAIDPPIISCDCLTAFMESDKVILYVPKESIAKYQEAVGWREFERIESL